MWTWIKVTWERIFFSLVGTGLIGYSIFLIGNERVTDASIVFGLGFLSFIYANVARFKKFKGLGFEAELWEDTKKEAEGLIQRLRDIMIINSRELILSRVKAGRFASGSPWESNWQLYDDLVKQHNDLNQQIDFSEIKREMDNYFLGDIIVPLYNELRKRIFDATSKANKVIRDEFGPVISDAAGHTKRIEQLRGIKAEIKDPYAVVLAGENLARMAIEFWNDGKKKFKDDFEIDIEVDQITLDRLEKLAFIIDHRPVVVTQELVKWANRELE